MTAVPPALPSPWLSSFWDGVADRLSDGPQPATLRLRVSDQTGPRLVGELPGAGSVAADRRLFRIASVTKVYVAAALYRLVEEGRLSLQAPLAAGIAPITADLLIRAGYDVQTITIDHVMRHVAGLRDHCSSAPFLDRLARTPTHRWTRLEQIDIATRLGPPLCAPGAEFVYSDTGYVVLGEVVERASNSPLAEALPSLLSFERLGLDRTRLDDGIADLEPQYLGQIEAHGFDPSFDLHGGGGLISTLEEVDRFLRAVFRGHVFAHARTLPALFAAELTPSDFPGYGHNGLMFRSTLSGQDVWSHTGVWGVQAAYLPVRSLALVASFDRAPRPGAYDKDALLADFASAVGRMGDVG